MRHVGRGLGIGNQHLILHLVAIGRDTADEEALLNCGAAMLADALGDGLAFPLPERHDHVHDEFAHRRRGVNERFRNRGEAHLEFLHPLVEVREVPNASRQSVDAEHQHLVDHPLLAVGDQPLVGGTVEVAAGVAVVIVAFGQGHPVFGGLGGDEALAHRPLGIDGVELLVLRVLDGLAGVDGDAHFSFAIHGNVPFVHFRSPHQITPL